MRAYIRRKATENFLYSIFSVLHHSNHKVMPGQLTIRVGRCVTGWRIHTYTRVKKKRLAKNVSLLRNTYLMVGSARGITARFIPILPVFSRICDITTGVYDGGALLNRKFWRCAGWPEFLLSKFFEEKPGRCRISLVWPRALSVLA